MTCAEYERRLLTRSWEELDEEEALEHADHCPRCAGLRDDLERAEARLAGAMSTARPSVHPAVVADRAMVGARLRSIEHGLMAAAVLVVAPLLWIGVPGLAKSTVALLTGRRPPPVLTTETIALRCLSAAQAQVLARPYLTGIGNSMTPGDSSISTLTVRGSAEAVKLAKEVIERFESHPNAACRRR